MPAPHSTPVCPGRARGARRLNRPPLEASASAATSSRDAQAVARSSGCRPLTGAAVGGASGRQLHRRHRRADARRPRRRRRGRARRPRARRSSPIARPARALLAGSPPDPRRAERRMQSMTTVSPGGPAAEAAAAPPRSRRARARRLEEHHAACGCSGRDLGPPRQPADRAELLRAFSKSGSYIAEPSTATDSSASAWLPRRARPAARCTATSPASCRRSPAAPSATRMKLHQRAWALARGIPVIEWTFDPLVARNAYFNIEKLAAMPVEYLTNFYGIMGDGINGEDETDRLLIQLAAARRRGRCSRRLGRARRSTRMLAGASASRWPCPPTSRRCGETTPPRRASGALRVRDELGARPGRRRPASSGFDRPRATSCCHGGEHA